MNKFSAYATLTCLTLSALIVAAPQEVYSRSFMFIRSIHNSLALRNAFWHDFIYDKEGTVRGSWQAIGFHQHSQGLGKTQRYFLQKHKDCVTIAGDDVTQEFFTRDMRAEWVGLPSTFSGTLTINPIQSQSGGYLEYNQDLGGLSDISFFKNLWGAFSVPFIFVENNFNLRQSDVQNPDAQTTPPPHDILQAFSQDSWRYDKFPTKKQRKAAAAEFRVDLGSTYKGRNLRLAYYSFFTGALAPKQDSAWVFSPYVGNDHHWSIGYGIHMDYLMSQQTARVDWSFFVDCEVSYLIHNKQHRTLDLFGKPWSRFLQFRRRNGPPDELIPGVNVMTIPVIVRPYGLFDFSIGWRVRMSMVVCEVTYSVWGHDEQKVKFRDTFLESFCNQEYGIAGAGTITVEGMTVGASASNSTIANQAPDDPTFISIKPYDLDFQSAAGSSAINHKAQIAIGVERKHTAVETFLGVGAFADIAQKNGNLQASGLWVKGGMSF
jgi:hypothetical protein